MNTQTEDKKLDINNARNWTVEQWIEHYKQENGPLDPKRFPHGDACDVLSHKVFEQILPHVDTLYARWCDEKPDTKDAQVAITHVVVEMLVRLTRLTSSGAEDTVNNMGKITTAVREAYYGEMNKWLKNDYAPEEIVRAVVKVLNR